MFSTLPGNIHDTHANIRYDVQHPKLMGWFKK